MRSPIDLPSWKKLADHAGSVPPMRDLFTQDPNRASTLSHRWNDLFIDYSKNRITQVINMEKFIDGIHVSEISNDNLNEKKYVA